MRTPAATHIRTACAHTKRTHRACANAMRADAAATRQRRMHSTHAYAQPHRTHIHSQFPPHPSSQAHTIQHTSAVPFRAHTHTLFYACPTTHQHTTTRVYESRTPHRAASRHKQTAAAGGVLLSPHRAHSPENCAHHAHRTATTPPAASTARSRAANIANVTGKKKISTVPTCPLLRQTPFPLLASICFAKLVHQKSAVCETVYIVGRIFRIQRE